MKEIILYTTEDGKCPFIEWIRALSVDFRTRINKRINRMKDNNFGDWKHLQNSKLCEMRFFFGKGYRVYFRELDNIIVLILAGSDKSDQKTTIKKAEEYLEDYMSRRNNDN